jgi:hypothetical protein
MSIHTDEQKKEVSDRMKKYWADKRLATSNSVPIKEDKITVQEASEPDKPIDTGKEAPTVASPMTQEERAIFNRVASESREWATIDPYATEDYSLAEDPFKLPEQALKLQKDKQFQFRWITRTPERLDQVKGKPVPFRWWPVNNVQPVGGLFRNVVDGSTGAVHLMDQMLVFKPWWMWEQEKKLKDRQADMRGDLTERDNEEIGSLRLAASKRKASDPRSRVEVSGSDIQFKGEADVYGDSYGAVGMNDLVVNE